MQEKTSFVLQARTGSSRLPQKIVLPFFKKLSILELQLQRILTVFSAPKIIIATTNNKNDDAIIDIANKYNVSFFRGDEDNVLNRFINCANQYELEGIVRICSDNVFLDIQKLVELYNHKKHNTDYVSFSIDNKPSIKTHFGLWAEWVSVEALKRAQQSTNDSLYTEHVTNYIYGHPHQFKTKFIPIEIENDKTIRLTTDTVQDFEIQQKIFSDLFDKHQLNFTTAHIFGYLNNHPEFKSKMRQQIIKNEK